MNDKDIEELKHHELSETMFCIMRCKNHKLTRAEVYRQKTEWLKKALQNKLENYRDEAFAEKITLLSNKIKALDVEDYDNDMEMKKLVLEVYELSFLDAKGLSHMEIKEKFHDIEGMIKLIDEYGKDPLTMVPKSMIKLRE